MPVAPGTRFGPYEIVSVLGTGGMGEVYKARDTRLARDVALKVLPPEVAGDPVRRQRFEMEARAVAALNHPNIVAIYDVGTENGILYMVTELVDGEPLRGMKLSLRRVLDSAVQIASGLAAAHAAAITHRDLKPDNILLTRDSRIKILDFGLAKVAPARSGSGETETLTALTDPGVVMGTVGYMSPEQVKGLEAEPRSDIFSLGLILFELLSGERAFRRETAVETMRAILKEDTPELPETVPAAVRQTVGHCLEKEPSNRFQSARDLAFALGAMSQSGPQSGAQPALPGFARRRQWVTAVGAALALLAISVAATLWLLPPAEASWSGAILGGPEMALDPRVSPDGHLLAFQAMDRGLTQVAVMKPETGNWSILTHDRGRGLIFGVAWSPDGGVIYYDRTTDVPQGIYSVPVLGGAERLILENAAGPESLPDGSLLAVKLNAGRQPQLLRFWPESGRSQDLPILSGFAAYSANRLLRAFPDGQHAAVLGAVLGHEGEGWRLLDVSIATGAARSLLPSSEKGAVPTALAVARDGKSVIAALPAGSLTRIVSIPTGGRSAARTLFTANALVWYLDATTDGSVYAALTDRPAELVRRSLGGAKSERIGNFPGAYTDMIATLADGRIVFSGMASGQGRLLAVEKGKDPVPLLNTTEETAAPMTVTGPREIAFVIGPRPHQTIAVADTTTGRIAHRIAPGKGEITSLASSPDGKILYFGAAGTVWSVPSSGGEPRMIHAGNEVVADRSGRYLLVKLTESTRLRLFRLPLDGGPEREINSDSSIPLMDTPTLSPAALNADGRLLVPLQPRDSWFNPPGLLDTATGRLTRLPSDDSSDWHSMAWLPNGLPDGQIAALHIGLRSTLWRFQPSK